MLRPALTLPPLLLIAGCFMELEHDGGFADIDEEIHSVVIEVDTGEVELRAGDGVTAAVDWETHWSHACPEIDIHASEGVLYVRGRCPAGAWRCGTDFRIQVPSGVEVEATVTTGSLDLEEVGPVRAELTTGQLDIRGAKGEVDLDVTTGGIHAFDLDVEELRASVVTGSLEIELDSPFELVDAEVITGDITIAVPHGCYDMDLDAITGSISTDGVSCDCDADSWIRAQIVTGTIDIYGE